jgi:uncharacterized membrane protein YkvI
MLWLINLIFFLLILVTVLGSVWLSRKFKERYAEFPWWKAAVLLVIEVVAWLVTYRFVAWIQRNIWVIPIVVIIVIVILMKRKKKKEQVL